MSTSFNTGSDTGTKYYIVDTTTGTFDYFARIDNSSDALTFVWHPLGKTLYYRYPSGTQWLVYDPATHTQRLLGDLPGGVWSRDGRYRAQGFALPPDQVQDRRDAGQSIPSIRVWDSVSGLTRLYCTPALLRLLRHALYWSPDNRYLAYIIPLDTGEETMSVPYATIYLLDTQSGNVTELPVNAAQIITWTEDAR